MDDLFQRHIKADLLEALASARVVNIIGPRQVGKTTLVRDLLKLGRFITLDDESILSALTADPLGQIEALKQEAGDQPLVIDEAQRSVSIALAIKKIVDANRAMGQFVLTGSSNVFTSAQVADSLAGRVQTLTMLPLSAAEIHRRGPPRLLDWASAPEGPQLAELPPADPLKRSDYIELILAGGYPEIRPLPPRARQRRYLDYVDTIVERDVADLIRIRKSDAMRRLIEQMAARTGNEINIQEISGKLGIQRATTDSYLDVLTKLALINRLPAWTAGETGRDIRQPKIHMVDTGVAAALRNLNADSFRIDANPGALGGLLETYVHGELQKALPHQRERWRLYHWRDQRGREIDILAESGRNLVGFEMKSAASVTAGDFVHFDWFRKEGPGRSNWALTGIVVYLGERVLSFGKGNVALPLSVFFG